MKACLNCQKEYENKREASKFCSDKCRVAYNRKHPKNSISKVQMQVLYNQVLELIGSIPSAPFEGITQQQNGTPTATSHTTKQQLGIELTFQQHMNKISTLVFPDERQDYILVVQSATNISEKQKQLLILNLKQSVG
jgi:hypothetical protein